MSNSLSLGMDIATASEPVHAAAKSIDDSSRFSADGPYRGFGPDRIASKTEVTISWNNRIGAALLVLARRHLDADAAFMGHTGPRARMSALVFLVLFVHSLPEGFAVGTAFASDRAGLSLFVILAIAIQNVPEGTSVAIPMAAEGFSRTRQFWVAVGTSAPQPVGALVAFVLVEQVEALLPFSFAFAAGAMLTLIAVELLPSAYGDGHRLGASGGLLAGAVLMLGLSFLLGV